MKHIDTIYKKDVATFIEQLWATDIFKNWQKQPNSFLHLLVKKIAQNPLFFYTISEEKEKKHLTALFRHIAYRKYENPYIQDLYYFHEYIHIATLYYNPSEPFTSWMEKISKNELIASLYSEVFVYFMKPGLLDKTFKSLWLERYITAPAQLQHNTDKYQSMLGYFHKYDIKVEPNLEIPLLPIELDKINITHYKQNMFNLNAPSLPKIFTKIWHDREILRNVQKNTTIYETLDVEEKWIVNFNHIREKWLYKWQPYYKKLEHSMNDFIKEIDEKKAILNLNLYLETQKTNHIIFEPILGPNQTMLIKNKNFC